MPAARSSERIASGRCFRNSVGWSTEATDIWLATDLVDRAPDPDHEPVGEEADMEVVETLELFARLRKVSGDRVDEILDRL